MSTDLHVVMDNLVEDYKVLSEEREILENIKTAKIEKINLDFTAKENIILEKQAFISAELRNLAEQVPQKHSKTQSKVSLLTGEVVIKKPKKNLVVDKERLVAWLQENSYTDYVLEKTTIVADWKEFKKRLALDEEAGGIIDTETGEILDITGVTVEEVSEQVVIK